MNKPISMIIKETKTKLVNVCNESGLTPMLLDLILQNIYSEVHYIAEKSYVEEEAVYLKTINDIQNEKDISKEEHDESK